MTFVAQTSNSFVVQRLVYPPFTPSLDERGRPGFDSRRGNNSLSFARGRAQLGVTDQPYNQLLDLDFFFVFNRTCALNFQALHTRTYQAASFSITALTRSISRTPLTPWDRGILKAPYLEAQQPDWLLEQSHLMSPALQRTSIRYDLCFIEIPSRRVDDLFMQPLGLFDSHPVQMCWTS